MTESFFQIPLSHTGWLLGGGPADNIVLATRARLHRNLSGFHFANQATLDDRRQIMGEIRAAVSEAEVWGDGAFLELTRITEQQRRILREKQLVRPEAVLGAQETALAVTPDLSTSLVINDRDHIQLNGFLGGFQPEAAVRSVLDHESRLEKRLCFSYQEDLGYLTSFAGSVGTGLHLSALIHLPGLVLAEEVDRIINALSQLRFSVKGLFGAGNSIRGSLFVISSQVTLGRDEEEIASDFKYHLGKVLVHEESARKQLHARDRVWLEDLVHRSHALLGSARLIPPQETLDRLSHLRLGVGLGILPARPTATLNQVLIGQQSGHLQVWAGETLRGSERARARASFLRETLAINCA